MLSLGTPAWVLQDGVMGWKPHGPRDLHRATLQNSRREQEFVEQGKLQGSAGANNSAFH